MFVPDAREGNNSGNNDRNSGTKREEINVEGLCVYVSCLVSECYVVYLHVFLSFVGEMLCMCNVYIKKCKLVEIMRLNSLYLDEIEHFRIFSFLEKKISRMAG